MLRPGQRAPDFELPDQSGSVIRFSEIVSNSNVVLFFYPKDGSPGCTKEACAFRDSYEKLTKKGYVLIGISPDCIESHRRFTAMHSLPFLLLSDRNKAVAKMYDVLGPLGLFVRRVTYVIERGGVIRFRYSGMDPVRHVREVLSFISSERDDSK